jgi:hypothetical protein
MLRVPSAFFSKRQLLLRAAHLLLQSLCCACGNFGHQPFQSPIYTNNNNPQPGKREWTLVDTSTNGTFINGVKVGKGSSRALAPGDTIDLSIVNSAPGQPQGVQLRFEYVEGLEPAAPPGTTPASKRKSVRICGCF